MEDIECKFHDHGSEFISEMGRTGGILYPHLPGTEADLSGEEQGAWKGRILQAVKCSRFGKERAAAASLPHSEKAAPPSFLPGSSYH